MVWVLWMTRNNIIFKDGVVDLVDMFANIKILSWNRFVNRKGKNKEILYSDWCTNPMGFIAGGAGFGGV